MTLEEAPKPTPGDNEVLIKVRAAALNPLDWHFMRGVPSFVRLFAGLRKPKRTRLGADVAGEVELVGAAVTGLKPGDRVFGAVDGALAEYVSTSGSFVAAMPQNMTFQQAAAAPIAGLRRSSHSGTREKSNRVKRYSLTARPEAWARLLCRFPSGWAPRLLEFAAHATRILCAESARNE